MQFYDTEEKNTFYVIERTDANFTILDKRMHRVYHSARREYFIDVQKMIQSQCDGEDVFMTSTSEVFDMNYEVPVRSIRFLCYEYVNDEFRPRFISSYILGTDKKYENVLKEIVAWENPTYAGGN